MTAIARAAESQHHDRMLRHDLTTLRLFVRTCELRSMTQAAHSLGMAPSAASRRLALLEQDAKTRLLRRRSHGVEPTPAGVAMLRYASEVIEQGERLEAVLAEYGSGVRGHVRIFASSSILVQRLAADLARFARAHPAIKIDLEERPSIATIEGLLAKQADLGIVVRGFETADLDAVPYGSDRLCLAVPESHTLARRGPVSLADIAAQDLVSLDGGTAVHRLVVSSAREAGQLLRVRVQVRSFEVMCQIIAQGLGVGVLPEHAARPLAGALGLTLVSIAEPWAERQFVICTHSRAALPLPARRLLRALLTPDETTGRPPNGV